MRHTYRIRLQHSGHPTLRFGIPPLTGEALTQSLAGAVVRELLQDDRGYVIADVQLQRASHEQALDELLVTLQQYGYAWVEASVTEWTDNALQGLLLGGAGCGAAGASSGSSDLALILGLVGALVGAIVGSFIDSAKVVYEAIPSPTGWQLVPVLPSASPNALTGLQPRTA